MLLSLTLFLRSTEELQGGERQGVAALQAVPVPAHRHPLLAQGQGAETQGEPTEQKGRTYLRLQDMPLLIWMVTGSEQHLRWLPADSGIISTSSRAVGSTGLEYSLIYLAAVCF